MTTDHQQIRRWAEERNAHPACVRGTGGGDDIGVLRLDFPGFTGAQKLQPIEWDEFFEKFDERGLALVYQDTTKSGQRSNFNKIVDRDTGRAARGSGSRGASGAKSRGRTGGGRTGSASRSKGGGSNR